SIDDLTALDAPAPIFRQLREEGMRSVLSVPLLVDAEAIGEINLASNAPNAFNAEHRDIAMEIAAPIAIAIQQARLREELGRQAGELERRLAERGAALPAVDCDPSLVRLALESLLDNALKFTRPRDHSIITIRPIEHEGQAGFAVQDTGIGFKMAYAAKLFGVFQRLHRPDEFEGNGA